MVLLPFFLDVLVQEDVAHWNNVFPGLSHQSVRLSSWVLASIILDIFHSALRPDFLYIGHNLIIIISISLIFKYSYL